MKRSHLVAACAAVVGTAAVVATAMTYSVVVADDGDGVMIVRKSTAQECSEGGGCVILSNRQGTNLVNYAAAMGAQAARRGTDKDL